MHFRHMAALARETSGDYTAEDAFRRGGQAYFNFSDCPTLIGAEAERLLSFLRVVVDIP